MQITKKKLFKRTVAKVMAAAMVVSMIPMPTTVSVKATEVENGTTPSADKTTNEVTGTNDEQNTTNDTSLPSPSNGIITLTKNVSLSDYQRITENTTINLNGYTNVSSTK